MIELKNKVILIISPEAWGTSFVSKHHYAAELAKRGNTVFFLNPPGQAWNINSTAQNVNIVNYSLGVRGLGRMPSFVAAFFTKQEVFRIERFLKTKIDIIWNFDSSRFFNLKQVPKRIYKIQHIVDLNQNYHRDQGAKTSDICFCTSDYIAKELLKSSSNVHKIHHGYQSHELVSTDVQKSMELVENKRRIKVGYVGNLSRTCIDWVTIFRLIDKHPETHFTFIGGYTQSNLANKSIANKWLDRLKKATNVTLLGKQDSYLIPAFLECFDVLLCVYKMEHPEDYAQHSNLHKTMEYMGSGKVILSSFVDEYKENRDLLQMSYENKEIPSLFSHIIQNIRQLNSAEMQQKRKEFAGINTYTKQVDRIEAFLNKN